MLPMVHRMINSQTDVIWFEKYLESDNRCSIIKNMKTIVEKITKEQLNTEEGKKIIGQAGDFLKEGGLVAFPTETVYGLGADALNKTASTKIYAAKGRPSDNPLIVHITNMGALDKIADIIPEVAY